MSSVTRTRGDPLAPALTHEFDIVQATVQMQPKRCQRVALSAGEVQATLRYRRLTWRSVATASARPSQSLPPSCCAYLRAAVQLCTRSLSKGSRPHIRNLAEQFAARSLDFVEPSIDSNSHCVSLMMVTKFEHRLQFCFRNATQTSHKCIAAQPGTSQVAQPVRTMSLAVLNSSWQVQGHAPRAATATCSWHQTRRHKRRQTFTTARTQAVSDSQQTSSDHAAPSSTRRHALAMVLSAPALLQGACMAQPAAALTIEEVTPPTAPSKLTPRYPRRR